MALNDLAELHALIQADAWELGSRTCRANVQSLGLLRADVREMLLALTTADHHKEFGTATTDLGDIEADHYKFWYDEYNKNRCQPDQGFCFYIKLGIHENEEGQCCVVASFHLDSRP